MMHYKKKQYRTYNSSKTQITMYKLALSTCMNLLFYNMQRVNSKEFLIFYHNIKILNGPKLNFWSQNGQFL